MHGKLTNLHYYVDLHDKDKATKKINKKLKDTGYQLQKLKRGVAHYKNDEGHNIISIKGTDPTHYKDLLSDVNIGLGMTKNDRQFNKRQKDIKKIYKTIPENEKIDITGHSLGGSIATSILSNSESIRNRTNKAELFNTGYTKQFHKSIKNDIDKTTRRQLNDKITHHHIKGDIISEQLKEGSIGNVKEYEPDKNTSLLHRHSMDTVNEII